MKKDMKDFIDGMEAGANAVIFSIFEMIRQFLLLD
jgi:hypothetical protein